MKILGKNLILYQRGTAVAGAKTCEIDISCDTLEVSSANAGAWRNYIAGRKEWSITCGFLVGYDRDPATFLNVGNTYTLLFQHAAPSTMYYFGGLYDGEVTDYYVSAPDEIYFSTTLNQFVAEKDGTYYTNWTDSTLSNRPPSTAPETDVMYFATGYDPYLWSGEEMYHDLGLSGTAIVTRCRITASVGGIAQGSFQFKGTGELAAD